MILVILFWIRAISRDIYRYLEAPHLSSMATSSGNQSTIGQATLVLEDALGSIAKLEKKGMLSKAKANLARRAVQKEYDDSVNAVIGKKGSTGGGGGGGSIAPAGGAGQQDAPVAKKDWPVNDSVKTLVAQTYDSFEEGKRSCAAAFVANSMYLGIGNHHEAATARGKKKSGHGAGRGYQDWEFNDGALGCRRDTCIRTRDTC